MATPVVEIWFADLALVAPGLVQGIWDAHMPFADAVLPNAGSRDDGVRRRRCSHQILRLLLARHIGSPSAGAPFHRDALGKPSLRGCKVNN